MMSSEHRMTAVYVVSDFYIEFFLLFLSHSRFLMLCFARTRSLCRFYYFQFEKLVNRDIKVVHTRLLYVSIIISY